MLGGKAKEAMAAAYEAYRDAALNCAKAVPDLEPPATALADAYREGARLR